jgi:hypothetical protein
MILTCLHPSPFYISGAGTERIVTTCGDSHKPSWMFLHAVMAQFILCSAAVVVSSNSLPAHRAVGKHRSGFMHAMLHSFCPRAHRSHDDHQPPTSSHRHCRSRLYVLCNFFQGQQISLIGGPRSGQPGSGFLDARNDDAAKADPARLGLPSRKNSCQEVAVLGPCISSERFTSLDPRLLI